MSSVTISMIFFKVEKNHLKLIQNIRVHNCDSLNKNGPQPCSLLGEHGRADPGWGVSGESALRKLVSASYLGSTIELALIAWAQVSLSRRYESRRAGSVPHQLQHWIN